MADTDQERTEEATPRKQEKAREEGQVPRSKELATAAVLISSAIGMLWFGKGLALALMKIFTELLQMERADIYDMHAYFSTLSGLLQGILPSMLAFMSLVFIAAIAGSIALGGMTMRP